MMSLFFNKLFIVPLVDKGDIRYIMNYHDTCTPKSCLFFSQISFNFACWSELVQWCVMMGKRTPEIGKQRLELRNFFSRCRSSRSMFTDDMCWWWSETFTMFVCFFPLEANTNGRNYQPEINTQKKDCTSLPSWKLAYPPKDTLEDDFSFIKVGYVSSLEGLNFCFKNHPQP